MASPLADVMTEVHGDAALAGVDFALGRKESKRLRDFPFVNWVPVGGTIQRGHQHVGPAALAGSTVRDAFGRDDINVALHIWGEDYETAVELRDALLGSMYRKLSGSVTFGEYVCFSEQDGTAEYAQSGYKLIQMTTVATPIWKRPSAAPLTSITAQQHEGHFVSDLDGSIEEVC